MIPSSSPTNRESLVSFWLAGFTLLSFCIGLAPIPLTAWVCYPAALLSGLGSMLAGFLALRRVKVSGEKGRALALIGIWTGVLTILAVIVLTAATAVLVYYGVSGINTLWQRFYP